MQEELLSIWRNTGKTILFVTHCANETAFLAQRALVLSPRPGRIREIVPIDLKHPRKRNSEQTDEIKNKLMSLIGEKN
jgi:ABC-type nitrate/sulfonate/bicarbonate transport system ATPase subunit